MLDPAGVNCPDVSDNFYSKEFLDQLGQIEKENKQLTKDLMKLSKKVAHLEKKIRKLKKKSK